MIDDEARLAADPVIQAISLIYYEIAQVHHVDFTTTLDYLRAAIQWRKAETHGEIEAALRLMDTLHAQCSREHLSGKFSRQNQMGMRV